VGGLRKRDHAVDLGVDGRISRSGIWSMAWIEPAQDRESWRDFVHAALNLRVLLNAGNFF